MTLASTSWTQYLNESRVALADAFSCAGTGQLWIYQVIKQLAVVDAAQDSYCFLTNSTHPDALDLFSQNDAIDSPKTPKNPFAKQDEKITLVWHGAVVAEQADPSQENRTEPQTIVSSKVRVSLPFCLEIKVGQWAILEAWGAQLNGKITETGSLSQPASSITIDLTKAIPFSADLVGRRFN